METMTVNGRTFRVLRLLGHGKGGYSYLVTDGAREYVLKQIHHEPCDYYQFGNKLESELRDYRRLKELGIRMPELYDVDTAQERLLKEYIAGDTVAQLVHENAVKPEYFRQAEAMCEVLYAAGLNIDYYPTNFVVQEELLYYIDYECNPYMEEWDFAHWGIRYWTGDAEVRT